MLPDCVSKSSRDTGYMSIPKDAQDHLLIETGNDARVFEETRKGSLPVPSAELSSVPEGKDAL